MSRSVPTGAVGALPARPASPRMVAPGLRLPPEFIEACRQASLQLDGPRLTMLGVTSSIRGEGRSSVAAAMAHIQYEDYGRRVALVDLDLERPTLAAGRGAVPHPGLCELADGRASLEDVLQPQGGGITMIAAGAAHGAAARAMAGVLRTDVLPAIGEHFDALIADLPPLLGSGCGRAAVTAFSDLLLVVRSGLTPVRRIRQATAHLPVPPRVLLNGTRTHLPPWLGRMVGC